MSDANDVMRRLADARPAHLDPHAPVDPHTRRAELAHAMAGPREGRAPRRSRRPLWGIGLAGAVAAVTLTAAVVVTDTEEPVAVPAPLPGHPDAAVVDLDARTVLLAAANGALRQPGSTGRYWHSRTQFGALEQVGPAARRYAVLHRYQHDVWDPRSPDDVGWFRSEDLGARPATPADEAAWRADGSPTRWTVQAAVPNGGRRPPLEMHPRDSAFAHSTGRASDAPDALNITQKELNDAPADPAALRRLLLGHPLGEADDGENTDAELFETAAGLLLSRPLPPDKRAALYRMLAQIKGVTATAGVRDAAGRPGIALKMRQRTEHSGDIEIHFIVDRATGAGLAKEVHVLRGKGDKAWLKPGTRWYYEVVTSRWVDVLPPMPRAPRGG
ncbi:MAG TPA: CU044_5270 family protein [Thermomonospora sp.]|nr:CU044_5270 family protein [Thermomonospora sp.]